MSRRGLIVGALVLTACAAAPAPPPVQVVEIAPPLPVVASTTSPVVDVKPPTPAPAPPDLAQVALPEPAACVLTTAKWRGVKSISELHFRANGPVFAKVAGGKGRVHLPIGVAAQGAGLEIADELLALRGYVDANDVWLHPAKAIVLGEAVIPHAAAKLGWTTAQPGAVAVIFKPREGVALVSPMLSAEVPCEALALDAGPINMKAGVPGLKAGKRGFLKTGHAIPLSTTAGGAPMANLTVDASAEGEITWMETSGPHARILWDRTEALVFGWVPASEVKLAVGPPSGWGYGSGSGSGFGRSVHPISTVVCPDDVPLLAEAEGERLSVGRILAGATINVMERKGEEARVVINSGVISFPNEVKLLVQAARLKGCPVKDP